MIVLDTNVISELWRIAPSPLRGELRGQQVVYPTVAKLTELNQ